MKVRDTLNNTMLRTYNSFNRVNGQDFSMYRAYSLSVTASYYMNHSGPNVSINDGNS